MSLNEYASGILVQTFYDTAAHLYVHKRRKTKKHKNNTLVRPQAMEKYTARAN